MSRSRADTVPDVADGMQPALLVGEDEAAAAGEGLASAPLRVRRRRRRPLWPFLLVLMVLGGIGYGGWQWWQSRVKTTVATRSTFVVRRGDLPITITEGGSLKALNAEVYKCEVEGATTIISLVPEGTIITEEDVKNKKILVELDSSDLRERLTQQEITYANAEASYQAAKEDYAITKSENESNIKNGELNVKFGRMDLEHYVGQELCTEALADRVDLVKLASQLYGEARQQRERIRAEMVKAMADIEAELAAPVSDKPGPPPQGAERPKASKKKGGELAGVTAPERPERLGGEALQTKRGHDASIDLAIEKFKRAADELIWTARLEKKGFVSANELEADQLALKSSIIDLQQALGARELFLRYEFPKKAEEALSIYRERGKELGRIEARARAALAQAEAKLKSAEATFLVQKAKFEKLKSQVDNCIIRATKPGLVVYATTGGSWRGRGEPIEEGSSVRERQEIIKLPDISSLAVAVKVHESVVDKVKVGTPANIRIDAFEKMRLTGKVHKVGVLPDSSSRWMNPDLKQYATDVSIDGVHPNLKPGMSAEVEILVTTIKDVIQVPVQAIAARAGQSVVYVVAGDGEEERPVKLGEANDKFVAVLSGLEEGEEILLEAPQAVTVEAEEGGQADKDEEKGETPAGRPSQPGPGGERRMQPRDGRGGQPGSVSKGRPKGTQPGRPKAGQPGQPRAGAGRPKGSRQRPSKGGSRPQPK